ncbi:hypothetical protein NPX13_g7164 [Xylaria arbuscula]|uniref:Uncharacterized protein n=1 Tax=Xylaria arbuscula TaxID=114810 RepID=A0A9W8NB69_9PEZI|nr:hypothetical protein NPX13_g7164 [Xylaria arbuscula]
MVNTLAAALAIVLLLGQAEAGLIAKVARTETPCSHSSMLLETVPTETSSVLSLSRYISTDPDLTSTGLPLGGIFVEPDPSDRPSSRTEITTTTTITTMSTTSVSPVSHTTRTSHTPEATPCEEEGEEHHHTGSIMRHSTTTARIPEQTTPTPTPTVSDLNLEQKFVQTTYWACATLGTEAHCGWHEPILDASSGAYAKMGGGDGGGRDIALRAGGFALFAVGVLMLA